MVMIDTTNVLKNVTVKWWLECSAIKIKYNDGITDLML